jgi:magnesium-transporting ATPase (P-type)
MLSIKYIKMAASSNFGNMFSVIGASIFLPFLPMLPLQVLTNNLLYDFSQTTIPTDEVDNEWLTKPRQWTIGEIRRFIIFIGPISSIFDYLTYFIMLYIFNTWNNPALFHTGWFVESLFTQTVTTQAWFWKHHRWQHRLILAKILHIWDGYVWQTIAISAFLVTGGGFCSNRLSSYLFYLLPRRSTMTIPFCPACARKLLLKDRP